MLTKRVGLPVLVIVITVLLVTAIDKFSSGVATAAPVGEVTLSEPIQIPVALRSIIPGDEGSSGRFTVRYEGNEPAWVGLDAGLVGPLSSGNSPLSISISSGQRAFSATGINQVLGLFSPGDVVSLGVDYVFPRKASNEYQAASATLVLLLHAVSAADNTQVDERGRAVGPVSWEYGRERTSVASREATTPSEAGDSPCVGEGCSPSLSQIPTTEGGLGIPPQPSNPIEITGTCCACLQSLLWIGLLYALLLVVGLLAAFYLGWSLRGHRLGYPVRRRSDGAPSANHSSAKKD